MATRANVSGSHTGSGVVKAASTIREGMPVVWDTGTLVEAVAVTTQAVGIATACEDGTWPAAAGKTVVFTKLGAPESVKVLVGTGGATLGAPAKAVSDGLTDATIGGATTVLCKLGRFEQTGVAGDLVGCWLGEAGLVCGS